MIDASAIGLIREVAQTEQVNFDNSRSREHVERLSDWFTRAGEAQDEGIGDDDVAELIDKVISEGEMPRKMGYDTITQHNDLVESAVEFMEQNEHLFDDRALAM